MKTKTLKLGILNIKVHPHPKDVYNRLMEAAVSLKLDIRIQTHEYGCLGNIQPDSTNGTIFGEIQRYTELDKNAPWLNHENHVPVRPDSAEAPKISPKYKPNYRAVMFSFYPAKHKLVFNASKLNPKLAEQFFRTVFNDPKLVEIFGATDVVMVQSREGVSELLKRPEKSKIVIRILRPNGDDISSIRTKILGRFDNQNVRSFSQVLEAQKGDDITPDKDTIELMEVARTDGEVAVVSRKPGEAKKKESTKDHPFLAWVEYDPEGNLVDEFELAADKAMKRFYEEAQAAVRDETPNDEGAS